LHLHLGDTCADQPGVVLVDQVEQQAVLVVDRAQAGAAEPGRGGLAPVGVERDELRLSVEILRIRTQ
jgi:hypothetical protein